jgi:hypothetical protein
LNLQDFTLLKEDGDSYTVGHPNGKSLRVAKAGLSPVAKDAVSKLKKTQNLDEGGAPASGTPADPGDLPFGTVNAPSPTPDPTPAVQDAPPKNGETVAVTLPPDPASAPQVGVPASAEQSAQSPAAANTTAQPDSSGQYPDASKGLNAAKGAYQKAAQAETTQGNQAAQSLQTYIDDSSKVPTDIQTLQKYQKQSEALQNAVASAKVDPNRIYKEGGALASTGSKITAALSVLLGGIGAGLTHQSNGALDLLNAAINRDIDAQKNDQQKATTLWKMNRENTTSEQAANLATRDQYLSLAKAQLQQGAATAQGPIAQARYAAAILPLDKELATNQWMRSVGGGESHPGSETGYANNLKIMQQVNPEMYKDMQSKYIPGLGVARVAPTPADRESLTALDEMQKQLVRAKAFAQTTGTTYNPFGEKNQEANDIQNSLQLSIGQLVNLKRINEFEAKKYTDMAKNPGAWNTTQAVQSFDDLQQKVDQNRLSTMKNLGVVPFAQAPSDQQARAWAMANPNDPRAAKIIQVVGNR